MCVCVCVSVCYRYTQIVHQKCSWPKCIKVPYHKLLEHIVLGEKTHAIPTKYTNLPTPLSYHDLWHFCGISLAISPPEAPTPTASCTWKLQVVALCCHRCSRNLRVNRGLDERRNIFFLPKAMEMSLKFAAGGQQLDRVFTLVGYSPHPLAVLPLDKNIKTSSPDCNQTHVAWWRWEISPKSLVVKATAPFMSITCHAWCVEWLSAPSLPLQ